MHQLNRDLAPGGMHGRRQLGVRLSEIIRVNPHLAGVLLAIRPHKGKARYDQAHAAQGQLLITGRQFVRRPAVVVTHPFPGGRAHQPVGQMHPPDHRLFE
jgi:predicted membrane chloride channel (bestrophin family)